MIRQVSVAQATWNDFVRDRIKEQVEDTKITALNRARGCAVGAAVGDEP